MKKMPVAAQELGPDVRGATFDEVVSGYTQADALEEASRCLQCAQQPCAAGCPVGVPIKEFIAAIVAKDFGSAYEIIRSKNNFPSICGRVCPAEYQCRKACVLTKKGARFAGEDAINIHLLERFVGDYGVSQCDHTPLRDTQKDADKKVAVVGSGPAGLCAAGELARQGVRVTMYEALHELGGVLRYGIPPFRLPRTVLDYEIGSLKQLGVHWRQNVIVGKTISLEELLSGDFDAVFLGLGAGVPFFLGVPGENLCNVYSANEYLTRVNLMHAYRFPEFHTPVNIGKHIVVVGGGNTAMDAARVAVRLQRMNGVEPNTTIVYRRGEDEMPARRPEIVHAEEEGVTFRFLTQPLSFHGDVAGTVRSMIAADCVLGEPDASGRRRPVMKEGSEKEIPCDLAIIALGLKANSVLTSVTSGLRLDKYGDVIVDWDTMETSLPGVYAGGDIVGGEGTVIEAMGMAKKAAAAILRKVCHFE